MNSLEQVDNVDDIEFEINRDNMWINKMNQDREIATSIVEYLCRIFNYSLPGVHSIDRDDILKKITEYKALICELDESISSFKKDRDLNHLRLIRLNTI